MNHLQCQKEKELNKRLNHYHFKKPISELKKDNLSLLIFKLLFEYKSLDYNQIKELVEIYNSTHMYVKRFHIEEKVINSLNKLEFEFQIIYFDSKLRLWTTLSDNESVLCELGESKIHKKFHYNPEFFKYLSIGFGNEFVYCLYSPQQKIHAIVNKIKNYPIKVGKSNNIVRRIKQLSISGSESLIPDLVFCTPKSTELEKNIHSILKAQFSQMEIPGRKEWFYTNKVEIQNIVKDLRLKRRYF